MPPCIGESNHEKRPDFLKIRRIETCPKAAKTYLLQREITMAIMLFWQGNIYTSFEKLS